MVIALVSHNLAINSTSATVVVLPIITAIISRSHQYVHTSNLHCWVRNAAVGNLVGNPSNCYIVVAIWVGFDDDQLLWVGADAHSLKKAAEILDAGGDFHATMGIAQAVKLCTNAHTDFFCALER